jgi:hypothetical protein
VNLYFFVEGKRTEPKVYRSWIGHVFPQLTEAKTIEEVRADNFLIVSGFGYPQCLNRIDEVLEDINRHGAIDHLFVCLDAEEEPLDVKQAEIENRIVGKAPATSCHAVIHNCCFETWFLGNKRMMKRNPHSARLREWKAFYDVSIDCPEFMGAYSGYRMRAHFHTDYLKEMLGEKGLTYSKQQPGAIQEGHYLKELVNRHQRTGHLQSFAYLLSLWRSIGGNL